MLNSFINSVTVSCPGVLNLYASVAVLLVNELVALVLFPFLDHRNRAEEKKTVNG